MTDQEPLARLEQVVNGLLHGLQMFALGLLALVAAVMAAIAAVWLIRYGLASKAVRRSMRQALRMRVGWPRLARMIGLAVVDPSPRLFVRLRTAQDAAGDNVTAKGRLVVPRLRLRADEFGVTVKVRTLPGIGRREWEDRVQELADAWGCARVAVFQEGAGRLRIRAVHTDPLTVHTTWVPTCEEPDEKDWTEWRVGVDEWATPAGIRLDSVPGMVISGLPGYGKTSLIGGQLLARYAPSRRVAFVIIDGKGGGDYAAWSKRAVAYVDDDLQQAHDVLERCVQLLRDRQHTIAKPVEEGGLGVRNFWAVGPTEQWPLVVVIIDEAQTFLRERKGSKDEQALIYAMVRYVEDLVKKGRSVGIVVVLATQKATSDAIPTSIRDVCPVLASFAQKTAAAAVAALGEDIREYPEADPVALQDPMYKGVLVVAAQGRPGFMRIRTPYVSEEDQDRVAEATADIQVDPWKLIRGRHLSVVKSHTA